MEAATHPFPDGAPAWRGFREPSWELFVAFESETADPCGQGQHPAFAFPVSRIWSNGRAAAGANPCTASEPNFDVAPLALEDVGVDLTALGGAKLRGPGWRVRPGETRTFEIGFYSDRPTEKWTLAAHGDGRPAGDVHLDDEWPPARHAGVRGQ